MKLTEYAQNELIRLDIEPHHYEAIMTVMRAFDSVEPTLNPDEISMCKQLVSKLVEREPLSPLTGDDSEWRVAKEYEDGDTLYYNARCINVYKDSRGAFDRTGTVFWEWVTETDNEGVRTYKRYYCNEHSHTPVVFPYTPNPQYVERPSGVDK